MGYGVAESGFWAKRWGKEREGKGVSVMTLERIHACMREFLGGLAYASLVC
jgi:hypothetical protein